MYPDDFTVYLAGRTIDDLNTSLALEIKSVIDWIDSNQLILDVVKTTCMIMGTN